MTHQPHPNKKTIPERFWSKVNRIEGGCWLWTAAKNKRGYGTFVLKNGKPEGAHRVSFMLTKGSIPDGKEIAHTCDNPSCVNPAHLFAATHTENMRDSSTKGRMHRPSLTRTHCMRGHEYTPENTYLRKAGGRQCKKCLHIGIEFRRSVQFAPVIYTAANTL